MEFCIVLLQYGLVAFKIYSEAEVLDLSLTLFLGVDLPFSKSLIFFFVTFSYFRDEILWISVWLSLEL